MNKRNFFKVFLLCVVVVWLLVSCNQQSGILPTSIPTTTSILRTPPLTWTPTSTSVPTPTAIPKLTSTLMPTSLPLPDADDVCLLYKDHDALWLKTGEEPAQEMGQPNYQLIDIRCPSEFLLPLVKVHLLDPPVTGTTYVMEHLIPHQCIQHPDGHEVWFNTQQPLDYGSFYNGDLWRHDLDNNTIQQILSNEQGGQFLQFSPDGRRLILAGSRDIKVMNSDGSELRQLFQFPEVSICSEINVWVAPIWLPDSSGVITLIPEGCLHSPDSWPFGLWWIPLEGQAVLIDESSKAERESILDPSPNDRSLDDQRYVYWQDGILYLAQNDHQPLPLAVLPTLDDGYVAFLCPRGE